MERLVEDGRVQPGPAVYTTTKTKKGKKRTKNSGGSRKRPRGATDMDTN